MKTKKAFTLIEVLIASSIFVMVAALGSTIFMNISVSERKTSLMNGIYEDARVITEQLSREIRNSTIDYEEYYSMKVLDAQFYGINRGCYGSRFYDPGMFYDNGTESPKLGSNPENLGVESITDTAATTTVAFPLSIDKNTGQNPWDSASETGSEANAFCKPTELPSCADPQTELYLISADGREKTIIAKQLIIGEDSALSMVRMTGLDKDTNGIIDIFTCSPGYFCPPSNPAVDFKHPEGILALSYSDIFLPEKMDETQFSVTTSSFVPISPFRSNIKDLKFIISPTEDPYKAFAEGLVQYQPYVTIMLTLTPSEKERGNYSGTPPEVTIQTTVSTGVRQKIATYPPTQDLGWIQDAIPAGVIP